MMSNLRLILFGPPHVELDGKPVEIKRRKALALLAYLAVSGQPQRRDTLAALLWPDSTQDAARKALRRDLSELNLALGGQWLDAEREYVGLRSSFRLDVAQFQRHLDECTAQPAQCPAQLEAAVTLYQGDFLAGFTLADSPAFDEWQFFQTETLRQACASALERLVLALRDHQQHEAAIPFTRRWVALDPLHEPAHRQLMQLYWQVGQPAAALRQYERCRTLLETELGVPPAPETTSLYHQIREGKRAPGVIASPAPLPAAARLRRHNLPTQTTSFIGRERELAAIRALLLDEPACRLLTLVGAGGIGKTRLALAAAAQVQAAFADGVCFVALAPISKVDDIIPAMAEALHFTFSGQTDPKDQLLGYLQQKTLLFVADNFEHLLVGAELFSAILAQAPGISLLVTSREPLRLQEEWVYETQGLTFPTSQQERSTTANHYSAIELFIQRARPLAATFPTADESAAIERICQLVEGMPLALELAASWIRTLTCREIATEIERSLDFLTTTLRNVPERHRSLKVVFEQTWVRLSPAEQSVLRQLSVFRGGCTRAAAEQVTGATLPVLAALVDKALLRRTHTGRYELHELVRQFAEAQLQTEPQAVSQVQQRHQAYFAAFLQARTGGVKGGRQKETLTELKADMDNVRLAWRRAVAQHDAQAIEQAAECLFVFYLYSSGHYEGQAAFQLAAAAFSADQALTPVSPPQLNLLGFLLAGQGYFLARTRDPRAGQVLLEQALALLRRVEPGDRHKQAFALLWLGWALQLQGRNGAAQAYVEASLPLLAETADHWGEAWSLLLWANCTVEGRPLEAEQALTSALAVCRQSGDQSTLGYILHNLGAVATKLGRYAQAQQYISQALRLFEELDSTLGRGYALQRQGQLAICQGEYQHAIHALQLSIAYFEEARILMNVHWVRLELGTAFRLQGEYNQAEQIYLHFLEAASATPHQLMLARCLHGLGCLAYDRSELDRAEQYQSEALTILQQLGHEPSMVAATLCDLGQVMVTAGEQRHAEAGQAFRQTLELVRALQLAPIALSACVGVAQLLARAGQRTHATELLVLAEQHEASTFATKQQARQGLVELTDQWPAALFPAADTQGRTRKLWATVAALVEALAAAPTPAAAHSMTP